MREMLSPEQMRNWYNRGESKDIMFRVQQLKLLKEAILSYEERIYEALYADLKKSKEESWVTEIGFVISEINHAIKHISKWVRPKRVRTNLVNFPSSSYILQEPLGVVLIIAPWNYPLQLLFTPLVGAIAAGNCVMLKPSEFAPSTAAVMSSLIESVFSAEYIQIVQGDGATVIEQLMDKFRYDHIFYTGSTAVGKLIYQKAAAQLIPVTLELGGKSPCIVEKDANIQVAANRIALAKFSNAGQMCVAPDYILVHKSIHDKFLETLKNVITQFWGKFPEPGEYYGKIIHEKHYKRIVSLLKEGTIVLGGETIETELYIAPTIIENVSLESSLMQEEIFGPLLPILSFETFEEGKSIISQHANPLALYVFSESAALQNKWTQCIEFGGGCINNCSWHLTNHHLPFGGRGNSGIGSYHGQNSFQVFSHQKAMMKTPTWFDPAIKYPPFKGKLKFFKWIIR